MTEKSKPANRDQKFVELWSASGFDWAQKNSCAKAAGFSPIQAPRTAGRIITSLIQNQRMQKALRKRGVNLDRLAAKIAELLEAKNYMARPIGKDEAGNEIYPPDNFIQLKTTDLAAKIADVFAPTRLDIDKRETKQVVFTAEVLHRFERFNAQREFMRNPETIDVEPITGQQG